MLVKGATAAQLAKAAKKAGVRFGGYPAGKPQPVKGGFRFTLATVGKRPKWRKLSTVEERAWRRDGREPRAPYRKTIPGAVCWHGHREFMRELFTLAPDAILSSTLATYRGREDFERTHGRTRYSSGRYFGYGIESGAECVDYAGPIRVEGEGA